MKNPDSGLDLILYKQPLTSAGTASGQGQPFSKFFVKTQQSITMRMIGRAVCKRQDTMAPTGSFYKAGSFEVTPLMQVELGFVPPLAGVLDMNVYITPMRGVPAWGVSVKAEKKDHTMRSETEDVELSIMGGKQVVSLSVMKLFLHEDPPSSGPSSLRCLLGDLGVVVRSSRPRACVCARVRLRVRACVRALPARECANASACVHTCSAGHCNCLFARACV